MVETAADILGEPRIAHGLRPVQQEIVIIEHVLTLLGVDIGGEQLPQFHSPAGAPGKRQAQHLLDRALGVDAARVDGKTRALGREPLFGFRKSLFVPDQVHQVGGIFTVVDREGGVETDLVGIFPQQARADAVEGACPRQRVRHRAGIVADHLTGDPFDTSCHLGGGAARERHQQDAPGIGAVDHQMGDAMGKRVGLAGTRAGDHQ